MLCSFHKTTVYFHSELLMYVFYVYLESSCLWNETILKILFDEYICMCVYIYVFIYISDSKDYV